MDHLPPLHNGKELFVNQYIGEVLSTSALILFACGIILSLRLRIFETFFGGLDRMYSTHKSIALIGISMIFAHFLLMPLTSDTPWGNRLGMTAMIGITILILLTLAHRIPFFRNDGALGVSQLEDHPQVRRTLLHHWIDPRDEREQHRADDFDPELVRQSDLLPRGCRLHLQRTLCPLLQKPYAYVVGKSPQTESVHVGSDVETEKRKGETGGGSIYVCQFQRR